MISMCRYWELGGPSAILRWVPGVEYYLHGADVLESISSQIPYHNRVITTELSPHITVTDHCVTQKCGRGMRP